MSIIHKQRKYTDCSNNVWLDIDNCVSTGEEVSYSREISMVSIHIGLMETDR